MARMRVKPASNKHANKALIAASPEMLTSLIIAIALLAIGVVGHLLWLSWHPASHRRIDDFINRWRLY